MLRREGQLNDGSARVARGRGGIMKHLGLKNGIDRRGPTARVQTSTEVCTAIDDGSCGGIDFCVFDMADCILEDVCIMDW